MTVKTHSFSSSERTTTDTDEAAIAADAIHGCSVKPTGLNIPADNSIHCTVVSTNKVTLHWPG